MFCVCRDIGPKALALFAAPGIKGMQVTVKAEGGGIQIHQRVQTTEWRW